MSRVAVVTCRGDNVDPDSPLLLRALDECGVVGELRVWDDPGVEWGEYDLVVVRSTWDYPQRRGVFLSWARGVARLENPYDVLEYSSDKHYLSDLEANGLTTVPSYFCDVGDVPTRCEGDHVVKPCVGAGSIDAQRYSSAQQRQSFEHVARLHASGRDALIQPYVDSVDRDGELAMIYIDGEFSHAMRKGAMLNVDELDRSFLFRREQMSVAVADLEARRVSERVLRTKGYSNLLYARVDLVRMNREWVVMELELVEPSLFLTFVPEAAARLARAIARRL